MGGAASLGPQVPLQVTDGSGPLTVDGTVNVGNRRDIAVEVLCDTVTSFLRRYTVNDAGAVTIVDTTLDGVTPYVPVGPVTRCTTVSGTVNTVLPINTLSVIVTRVFGAYPAVGSERVTSAAARRIQIYYDYQSGSLLGRPSINGMPLCEGASRYVIGSLETSGTVAPVTIRTHSGGDDVTVIEEL